MLRTFNIMTDSHQGLYDITGEINDILNSSGIRSGILTVFAREATAVIMIQ